MAVDPWINSFYGILNGFGFPDPLHAVFVHMPMGLIIGAFCFAWLAALTRWKMLAVTAYHCVALAFLFLLPTIAFGFMDWRHFYLGAWLTPIKIKMVLAFVVFILSLTAILLGFKGKESSKITLAIYTISVIAVVGLGWFGARLVYGGQNRADVIQYEKGKNIFMANCNTCHARGGNITNPDRPLKNSVALDNFNAFLSLIRKPEAPMPAFTPAQISDPDARELFQYINHEIKCPKGS